MVYLTSFYENVKNWISVAQESEEEKVNKFVEQYNEDPAFCLESGRKELSDKGYQELLCKIAEKYKDDVDGRFIHIWDKNGGLGIPGVEESYSGKRKELRFGNKVLTSCSVQRKRNGRFVYYYNVWVVESQSELGKILLIHPKGDLKDLGSGEIYDVAKRFTYVNDREIMEWGLASSVEEYRQKEEEKEERMLAQLRQDAEKSTPELDRDLLKKHAPELYESLENKGAKREEAASSLEGREGRLQNY